MNIVIFAGGSGTRFWPISRNKYPKQFHPIINNQSTISLLANAAQKEVGWANLYFGTTELLVSLVKNTFPKIPTQNIFPEPEQKDNGPAVALAMAKLAKLGAGEEPVLILWSDSFPANTENFLSSLRAAATRVQENPKQLVFFGETPKFANENLGWFTTGKEVDSIDGDKFYKLAGFKYRPSLEDATKWAKDGKHLWNTGYFLTTPNFVLETIEKFQPEVSTLLKVITKKLGTDHEVETIAEIYPQMPSIHFDNLVVDHLSPDQTVIVAGDYAWNDPGTLYALKQYLQEKDEDNVCKGMVYPYETKDSLIYNFVNNQLVATIGLDGFVVVNTPDAIFVCHKDDIGKIKGLLGEFKGTELEKLL